MTPPLWRQILRTNFRKRDELAAFLQLEPQQLAVRHDFPLNLPRRLAEKIEKGTLDDPLLRQFVPLYDEALSTPGFLSDAVGDEPARCGSHLLRKYAGRVMIMPTGACPLHCRYCFRQHFDYDQADIDLEPIRKDVTLHEAILSGGDPLMMSDDKLAELLARLDAIPHLRRLRIHTRFPVAIPERITGELLEMLQATRLQTWFVIHTNHPRELDEEVLAALKRIQAPILTQSVLLKGVNDSVETLVDLFEQCADAGIIPYYLHQADRVKGTAHFQVPVERGLELMEALRRALPGYAVPRYVTEEAGKPSKTTLRCNKNLRLLEYKETGSNTFDAHITTSEASSHDT